MYNCSVKKQILFFWRASTWRIMPPTLHPNIIGSLIRNVIVLDFPSCWENQSFLFLKIQVDGQKPKVIHATAKIQSKLENWCKHTLTLILTIIPNLSPRIIQEKLLGLSIERILTKGVTRMDTLNQFGHIMFITQRYIKWCRFKSYLLRTVFLCFLSMTPIMYRCVITIMYPTWF